MSSDNSNTTLHVDIKFADKNSNLLEGVLSLLHEWPDQFIHGKFEERFINDYNSSDVLIAHDSKGNLYGCILFNRSGNEYNWLAISKKYSGSKGDLAIRLFEYVYPTLSPGTIVSMYPNTEDSKMSDVDTFSGESYEAAKKLYRRMGFADQMTSDNRIENYYGEGSHVYRITWIPDNNINRNQEEDNLKKIYISNSKSGGYGIFAKNRISSGDIVIMLIGNTIHYHTDYTIPINEFEMYEPRLNKSVSQFMNHSCNPNIYPSNDGRSYIAMRDINQDEELVTSYAFLGRKFGEERSIDGAKQITIDLNCRCGDLKCRGMIRAFDDLSHQEQIDYKDYALPFLRNNVQN